MTSSGGPGSSSDEASGVAGAFFPVAVTATGFVTVVTVTVVTVVFRQSFAPASRSAAKH